jgi:2-hydroxy-4-(methylsulfanyl)butanoate S-methyltransferase
VTADEHNVRQASRGSARDLGDHLRFHGLEGAIAALEFDLFTHIADGADLTPVLAKKTGIAENRLVTLLTALKSLGLIAESEGHFTNAPATARYLVAGAAGDFRDYVSLVNGAFGYESFRHLGAALRGERVFPDKGFYEGLIYDAGIGGESF